MDENKSIVTLIDEERRFKTDLELPANVRMSELGPELASFLAELEPKIYGGTRNIRLITKGYELEENETLASRGLWSGSVIKIKGE